MQVLYSKRVVLPGNIEEAFVLVENGVIKDVGNSMPDGDHYELVELNNQLLIPGVTDPHVHINEPGRTGRKVLTRLLKLP